MVLGNSVKESKDARKRVVTALQNIQNVIQALEDFSVDVDPDKFDEDMLEERIQQQEDARMRLLIDEQFDDSRREAEDTDEEIDEKEFHARLDARIQEQEEARIKQAEQAPRLIEIEGQRWHTAIQEARDGSLDARKLEISDFDEAVFKGDAIRAIRQAWADRAVPPTRTSIHSPPHALDFENEYSPCLNAFPRDRGRSGWRRIASSRSGRGGTSGSGPRGSCTRAWRRRRRCAWRASAPRRPRRRRG
jgi:hypothetical protein